MFVHSIEFLLLIITELIKIVDGFILHTFSIATIDMHDFIKLHTKNLGKYYLYVSFDIFKLKEKESLCHFKVSNSNWLTFVM